MPYSKDKRPSDNILARVLTPIALHPGAYWQRRVMQETGITDLPVNRAVVALLAWGWIEKSSEEKSGKGGLPKALLAPTDQVAVAIDRAVGHIHDIFPEREQQLFAEAVEQRREIPASAAEGTHDETRASYLGRAVLLSEAQSLGDAGWFNGFEGWRSLIELEANRQNQVNPQETGL